MNWESWRDHKDLVNRAAENVGWAHTYGDHWAYRNKQPDLTYVDRLISDVWRANELLSPTDNYLHYFGLFAAVAAICMANYLFGNVKKFISKQDERKLQTLHDNIRAIINSPNWLGQRPRGALTRATCLQKLDRVFDDLKKTSRRLSRGLYYAPIVDGRWRRARAVDPFIRDIAENAILHQGLPDEMAYRAPDGWEAPRAAWIFVVQYALFRKGLRDDMKKMDDLLKKLRTITQRCGEPLPPHQWF